MTEKPTPARWLITGFDANNPNQCPNSLRWSLDNRVELMPSTGGGLLHAVKWASGGQDPGSCGRAAQSAGVI